MSLASIKGLQDFPKDAPSIMRQQLRYTINHSQIIDMAVQELAEEDDIQANRMADAIKEDS